MSGINITLQGEPENDSDEYDPHYNPIIYLPEVVVLPNEEDETVLLKVRAKLYRWDSHDDPPEWKERGTGELKILRNTVNNNVRVVMRRDKTLKVCANHFIVPWLELTAKTGTDRAYVYSVIADFADELAKSETFAVKFGTVETAKLFKEKFEEAKEIVQTKCSLYNGDDKEQSGDDKEQSADDKSDSNDEEDESELSNFEEDESKLLNNEGDEKKDDATTEVTKKLNEMGVSKDEGELNK